MGCEAIVFYQCLADLLATYWEQEYSQTISWLRCRLSFALLQCSIMCIRRSRSLFCFLFLQADSTITSQLFWQWSQKFNDDCDF